MRYGDDVHTVDDPYRWLPTLGEIDLHLIGEGRHERLWDALGAHVRTYDTPSGPVTGTSFAVWAPTAQGVRVTGDFDGWAGWTHPMRSLGSSGVWEIFVPGVGVGTRYKFRDPRPRRPVAREGRPDGVRHRDPAVDRVGRRRRCTTSGATPTGWRAAPRSTPHAEPMSVYEVHLGLVAARAWTTGRWPTQLVDYLDETGFTHIELLPVAEHPFGGSWGYQVTSYYAPTARFGTPDDFRYFVDTLHQAGYGVIVDWVPAHFPKDDWALARFDGTPLYEHADPRRGEQPDWGTFVFDFGRREVRNFLVANALYWIEKFHVDGLRVDAVASMLYLDYSRPEGQWLPNVYGGRENLDAVAFLQEMNATVYRHHPGVMTIAEESTAWPGVTRPTHLGGLGFGFKWNMGWMHDTLSYIGKDPIYRGYHHNQMTFSLMYAFSENFVLPISHDEVVHGKGSLWERMPGDAWNKAANVRALLAYMWAHPGKQLLFMGGEFGQAREWSEERSLDWDLLGDPLHGGIKSLVGDLNRVYKDNPALWTRDDTPEGFSWIDANDASRQRAELPAPRRGRRRQPDGAGLRRELLRRPARRLPGRPALRRALARGAQHRRRDLRRLGRGQPRGRRGRAAGVARAARVGRAAPAAVRGAVAGPRRSVQTSAGQAADIGQAAAGGAVRPGGRGRHEPRRSPCPTPLPG